MFCVALLPRELGFNWWIVFSLLLLLTVSVVVFNWQVRRWTTHRAWHALLDFSRARSFTLTMQGGEVPSPLDRLDDIHITVLLRSSSTLLLQFRTRAGTDVEPPRWHVLLRNLSTSAWPTTALRPSNAKISLIDLFSLGSFPDLGDVDRFMVFGADSVAAKQLAASQVRALLPRDVGLLLFGNRMLLDFSGRPFDPIELGRMTALADQLVGHLPV